VQNAEGLGWGTDVCWRFARRSAWWAMRLLDHHLSINSLQLMLLLFCLFFRAHPTCFFVQKVVG